MLSVSSVRDPFLRALSEQVKHSVGLSFWLSVHSLSLFRDDARVFDERYRSRCGSHVSIAQISDGVASSGFLRWASCQQLDHE